MYEYAVSGIAKACQSDAGERRVFFWCKAYSDKQALAWAEAAGKAFLSDFKIDYKKSV